ncbi:MAG: SEL1-like repeat protein [Gammaproteobacteria bacterium]
MKYLMSALGLCLVLVSGLLLAADFNAAMTAYERQDYATAAREFTALAQSGDTHAQYMLGRLHSQGKGVAQDYVEAHKWYNLAASHGHKHAGQARDTLSQRMSSTQVATAQREARQWKSGADKISTDTPPLRQTINSIQRSLNELGYDAGVPDGLMGAKTRAAIREYQYAHGLDVDSQPTESLREHLAETLRTAKNDSEKTHNQANDWPWRRLLLHDAFRDGDYTRDPAWTVDTGSFSVESGAGLRTVHTARRPLAEAPQEDLPMAILGAILGEVNRSRSQGNTAETPDLAEIHVVQNITNAFALELGLNVRQATGPLVFGPYQGSERSSGYHLVYTPDAARGLHLVRLTSSGSSIIESVDQQFTLNQQYAIQWTRDSSGVMVVSLDDNEVFRVTDRNFRDSFDGFTLINKGGDYTISAVTIHGTN